MVFFYSCAVRVNKNQVAEYHTCGNLRGTFHGAVTDRLPPRSALIREQTKKDTGNKIWI